MTPRIATALVVLASACTGVISDPTAEGPGSELSPDGPPIATNDAPLDCTDPDQPGPRMLRLLTREEYAATVADLLSIAKPAVDELPVEPRVAGYDNNAAASIVTSRHLDAYLAIAERLVRDAPRAKLVGCELASAPCRTSFVERFGRRAFRRPLTPEERSRYEQMFASELSPTADQGVSLVVTAMLVSPSFLYRSELGTAKGDGTFALTPFEIASALSYTFLGAPPDDRLLDLAAKGALDVEAEARSLLADPRSRVQVGRFFHQWLDTGALLSANKDKSLYPSFTDAVRTGLAAEETAFVNHVVFDGTHAFGELLTADYVFADRAVAAFYGLTGEGRIAGGPQRGGILTLGSVLASHAHANESSPIRRGKFVRERLLCQELLPPPPSADTTPPGLDATLTTRERFAKHTSDPACRSCHQFIDGVGFSFERYDGVGAYREVENGKPIDASGEIKGRESIESQTLETFEGPKGLAALLAKSETAPKCFATQWFRFARGLREAGPEVCTAHALGKKFLEKKQDIRELMVAVVTQRSFLIRREK